MKFSPSRLAKSPLEYRSDTSSTEPAVETLSMLLSIETRFAFSRYRKNSQHTLGLCVLAGFFLAVNCGPGLRGEESGLYGKWLMTPRYARQSKLTPASGKLAGTIRGARLSKQSPAALVFDGKQGFVTLTDNLVDAQLPRPQLTVEAWVLVESTSEWGAFASAIQDNGEYERGWMLGHRGALFCFGLVSS